MTCVVLFCSPNLGYMRGVLRVHVGMCLVHVVGCDLMATAQEDFEEIIEAEIDDDVIMGTIDYHFLLPLEAGAQGFEYPQSQSVALPYKIFPGFPKAFADGLGVEFGVGLDVGLGVGLGVGLTPRKKRYNAEKKEYVLSAREFALAHVQELGLVRKQDAKLYDREYVKAHNRKLRTYKDSNLNIKDKIRRTVANPVYHPVYNPVYNPVYASRRTEICDAEARAWHANNCDSPLLTREELALKATEIISRVEGMRNFGTLAMYFGQTRRSLADEGLRFLTERGANQLHLGNASRGRRKTARNRPVLQWQNGNHITMNEAREILGFQSIALWKGKFLKDATSVEEALQRHYDYLPLGERLWRHVAKGRKRGDELIKRRRYQVFLSFTYGLGSQNVKVVQ